MDKNVGFNRNVFRPWLDAAALFCAETGDWGEVRARLDPIVGQDIASAENRRRAIDILIHIWGKTATKAPALHREATERFRTTAVPEDRLWLHYGMALLAYPLFREVGAVVGQIGRREERITSAMVKGRLIASRGQLGSLGKAVERILFSLRDWGVLAATGQRYACRPRMQELAASEVGLEAWLLACALRAHPAEELPFADLVRLPELFPFRLTARIDDLRQRRDLIVQRQGSGWDMVRRSPPVFPRPG